MMKMAAIRSGTVPSRAIVKAATLLLLNGGRRVPLLECPCTACRPRLEVGSEPIRALGSYRAINKERLAGLPEPWWLRCPQGIGSKIGVGEQPGLEALAGPSPTGERGLSSHKPSPCLRLAWVRRSNSDTPLTPLPYLIYTTGS